MHNRYTNPASILLQVAEAWVVDRRLNGTIVGAVVEGGTIVGAVVKRDVPNEGARVTGNAAGWSGGGGLAVTPPFQAKLVRFLVHRNSKTQQQQLT